jgi:putative transcriptional regulator
MLGRIGSGCASFSTTPAGVVPVPEPASEPAWAVPGAPKWRAPHRLASNTDLAQRIGVTRQTIIAIEQGRYSPSLEMAFQIARVFKVPLEEVFQYPDSEGQAP